MLLSLAAARAPRLDWQERLARAAVETLEGELALHREYAASWGIPAAELEAERPGPTTRAYTDFLLRTASLGDFADAVAALLPCVWGYSWLGQELAAGPPVEGNRYASWIATYADPEFAALAAWCRDVLDAVALDAGDATRARMREAFLGGEPPRAGVLGRLVAARARALTRGAPLITSEV